MQYPAHSADLTLPGSAMVRAVWRIKEPVDPLLVHELLQLVLAPLVGFFTDLPLSANKVAALIAADQLWGASPCGELLEALQKGVGV